MKISLRKIELTEKRLKLILFFLSFFVFIAAILVGTYTVTTSPSYCSQCHEMKPEFYTWKASSHNRFKCTDCHLEPGIKNFVLYEKWALKEIYEHLSGVNYSPIIMPKPIKNAVCNRCHDMNEREVTPTGDIIIPHSIHEENGIVCSKCHNGIAHGSVASRNITYSSDYDRWDEYLGKSIMSDSKFTQPNMDACMNCHAVRNGPLSCKACHSTGMLPASHKNEEFKNGMHGKTPDSKLPYCHSCHKLMTDNVIDGLEEKTNFQKYLEGDKKKKIVVTIQSYAKENDFCKKCHGKRPPSHKEALFLLKHGEDSKNDTSRCLTCHEYNPISKAPVTSVACNSCHPSTHEGKWIESHAYYELPKKPQIKKECFKCHNKDQCTGCHTTYK